MISEKNLMLLKRKRKQRMEQIRKSSFPFRIALKEKKCFLTQQRDNKESLISRQKKNPMNKFATYFFGPLVFYCFCHLSFFESLISY